MKKVLESSSELQSPVIGNSLLSPGTMVVFACQVALMFQGAGLKQRKDYERTKDRLQMSPKESPRKLTTNLYAYSPGTVTGQMIHY